MDQIIASTQHPLALDAFVSILFAPQARLSFDGMVAAMQCPVCMVYGREDPWVVPLWGQRLKRLLADAVYLEVSNKKPCRKSALLSSACQVLTLYTTCVLTGIIPFCIGWKQAACSACVTTLRGFCSAWLLQHHMSRCV